jgi:hypothetical protein
MHTPQTCQRSGPGFRERTPSRLQGGGSSDQGSVVRGGIGLRNRRTRASWASCLRAVGWRPAQGVQPTLQPNVPQKGKGARLCLPQVRALSKDETPSSTSTTNKPAKSLRSPNPLSAGAAPPHRPSRARTARLRDGSVCSCPGRSCFRVFLLRVTRRWPRSRRVLRGS